MLLRSLLLVWLPFVPTLASAQLYGDWMVDKVDGESTFTAMTINESKSALAKVCNAAGCNWVVLLPATNCKEGNSYPALLSSGSGSGALTLVCSPNAINKTRYVIQETQTMDEAAAGGDRLGLATPLESGEFRVARFPTKGWARAHERLAERVFQMRRSNSDQTL